MSYYQEHYNDYLEPYSNNTGYYVDNTRAYSDSGGASTDDFTYNEPLPEPYTYDTEPYSNIHNYSEPDCGTSNMCAPQDNLEHPALYMDDPYPSEPEPGKISDDKPFNDAFTKFERNCKPDHVYWLSDYHCNFTDEPEPSQQPANLTDRTQRDRERRTRQSRAR